MRSYIWRERLTEEISLTKDETFPPSPEEWAADTKVWMKVACKLQSQESTLKFTPEGQTQAMNFSIWKDATKYEYLDVNESEWKSISFTHANHLSDLESATLTLYQDMMYWEKDILPDLSGEWKTLEYLLPNAAPEGYWKKSGSPTKIKYILFKFYGKSTLTGSFEIKKANLVRAAKTADLK